MEKFRGERRKMYKNGKTAITTLTIILISISVCYALISNFIMVVNAPSSKPTTTITCETTIEPPWHETIIIFKPPTITETTTATPTTTITETATVTPTVTATSTITETQTEIATATETQTITTTEEETKTESTTVTYTETSSETKTITHTLEIPTTLTKYITKTNVRTVTVRSPRYITEYNYSTIVIPEILSKIETETITRTTTITIPKTEIKTEITPYTMFIAIPEQSIVPQEGNWALYFLTLLVAILLTIGFLILII
jgi:hypothetical protein